MTSSHPPRWRSLSMRRLSPLPLLAVVCFVSAGAAHAGALARLGHAVVPTSQSVRLTLDPSHTDFTGSVHIELKVAARADSFQLNSRGIKLSAVKLAGPSGP